MRTLKPSIQTARPSRRGAAAVFMAALLPVLLAVAAFTINVAHIQLIRLEHKVAVDAATRAAATKLAETDSSAAAATEARRIAQMHRVGSAQFDIDLNDVDVGNAEEQNNGTYQFQTNRTPLNAVQVLSDIGAGGANDPAALPLFFNYGGNSTYTRTESSVASFLVNEVVLCLDRSGSMKFDMTGGDWHYPTGNPQVNPQYQNTYVTSTSSSAFWDYYYAPPHPTDSRWAILRNAIDVFFTHAGQAAVPPRVGLVTWSSSSNSAGTTTLDYALPPYNIAFNGNRGAINGQLISRGNQSNSNGVFGGTLIADGLQAALNEFQNGRSRRYSNKIIILLSDGVYQGTSPYNNALVARDRGIRIYSIALLSGSAFAPLNQAAEVTGGDAYMATNAQELNTAFEEIAKSLDTLLIQ